MNPEETSIPLPKEPRHQRFADLVLSGRPLVDAYMEAGFRCTRATANANAKKLRKKADVKAYIAAVQSRAADDATLSLNEILLFCARVVRVPVACLDPRNPEHPDGDLVKSFSESESEASKSFRLEKHDPFKAIDTHLKLTGNDSEANCYKELAEAFARLPKSVLPVDKM